MGDTTLREIQDELRSLLEGRAGILDGILAPIIFVLANAVAGMPFAAYAGVGVAVAVVLVRLARRNDLKYAVSGLFGTGLAIALALRSGDAQDYFLPGIISGVATTLAGITADYPPGAGTGATDQRTFHGSGGDLAVLGAAYLVLVC